MRILRKGEVLKKVPFSAATLERRERQGKFPKRVPLGDGKAVGWIEGEIDNWIAGLIAERDSKPAEPSATPPPQRPIMFPDLAAAPLAAVGGET